MNFIYLSYLLLVSGLTEASATWKITMGRSGGGVIGYPHTPSYFPTMQFLSSKVEIDLNRAKNYKKKRCYQLSLWKTLKVPS